VTALISDQDRFGTMSNGRKLRRSRDNKMIAGVAAGVAEFFDLDATIVRIVWVLMVVLAGFGGLLYVIMWIVVPMEGSDRTIANDVVESAGKPQETTEEE